MAAEELTLAYSLAMLALFATIVPRVYEPRSRRPDVLRATWAAAVLVPWLYKPPALPLCVLAAFLAYRGRRVEATLLLAGSLILAYFTPAMYCSLGVTR